VYDSKSPGILIFRRQSCLFNVGGCGIGENPIWEANFNIERNI